MDWQVFWVTFGTIFLAEMGDKTQLAALTLTADDVATWALTGNYIRTQLPPGIATNQLLGVRLGPVRGRASLGVPVPVTTSQIDRSRSLQ